MPKRRANVDSDDEGASVGDSPVTKRARTVESDEEPPAPTSSNKRGPKGKSRRRDDDDDEEEASEGGESDAEEAERKFEEEHEERIRAALDAKRNVHGASIVLFHLEFYVHRSCRELPTMGSLKPSRCTSSCATSI